MTPRDPDPWVAFYEKWGEHTYTTAKPTLYRMGYEDGWDAALAVQATETETLDPDDEPMTPEQIAWVRAQRSK